MDNREIEVRFLEIDIQKIMEKCKILGAEDKGESFLKEIIFYDFLGQWKDQNKYVRLRENNGKTKLTYKHFLEHTIDGAQEFETEVESLENTQHILEAIGLKAYRFQEKKRHTFVLENTSIDIDTWPQIPSYVEIEGKSEEEVKKTASLLDLDWNEAVFESARAVIEKRYNIPVSTFRYFTFDKIGI